MGSLTTAAKLERTLFTQSRDREYFDRNELATMTGQPAERFPDVIVKELADNALDAAESAGVVPKLVVQVWRRQRDLIFSVQDNGPGIPPEALENILDFRTRTSDKAAYRSPTRGLQGNALKTVLGMPYALGSRQPLMIETRGKKHVLRPSIDPAGEAHLDHYVRNLLNRGGTCWKLSLPARACTSLDLRRWMRGYALFNPHAVVKFRDVCLARQHGHTPSVQAAKFYKPTVGFPEEWTKFLPTDLIPINWYDASSLAKLIFNHIAKASQGGHDLTLREFVCRFPGFASTQRVSKVCAALPEIKRLTDFKLRDDLVPALLTAMQEETAKRPPKPDKLGVIGAEHFRTRFEEWFGVQQDADGKCRFWYDRACLEVDGIPHVFEVAVAQTNRPGRFFHGINFSPTFADPFAGTEVCGKDVSGYGVAGYLSNAHAFKVYQYGTPLPFHSAVAVHLVSPVLQFLDKGKTKLAVPDGLAFAVGDALWEASKVLYREGERRKKDAAKQQRADEARVRQTSERKVDLTKVMPLAMPETLSHATGGMYRVSAHTLFYTARKVFQKYTSKELESQYFEQKLLPPYLRVHPEAAKWIYREARGVLYEPHTGVEVPLGTREVESYRFPSWRYRSILFVEKQGLYPMLKDAKLGERYDMAIVAGEGFATEACRVLFANAEKGDYQLFVSHDADPWGYNIGRTLREETARMPGYNVDVISLGLTVQDALDAGLSPEWATRDKSLPKGLKLSALEEEYFLGEQVGKKSWTYRRFELNAFTAPQYIAHLERQLQAHGCQGKVIPPANELPALTRPIYEGIITELVRKEVNRAVSTDAICQEIARRFHKVLPFHEASDWITHAFAADPSVAWDQAVEQKIRLLLEAKRRELEEAALSALHRIMGTI